MNNKIWFFCELEQILLNEFFPGLPNMVKSQIFDDILGNIDHKKNCSTQIKDIYKLCILCQQKLLWKCIPREFYRF